MAKTHKSSRERAKSRDKDVARSQPLSERQPRASLEALRGIEGLTSKQFEQLERIFRSNEGNERLSRRETIRADVRNSLDQTVDAVLPSVTDLHSRSELDKRQGKLRVTQLDYPDGTETERHALALQHSPSPTRKRRARLEPEGSDGLDDEDCREIEEAWDDPDQSPGVELIGKEKRVDELDAVYPILIGKLQQKGLKRIIKEWIKRCHQHKQMHHKYCKQEETAPDYWPLDKCRHIEPDHIKKDERTPLAVHLLCAGDKYEDATFNVDDLEKATMNITDSAPNDCHPDTMILLNQLYAARRAQIKYEEGMIDGDTLITVLMPAKVLKSKRASRPKKQCRTKAKPDDTKQLDSADTSPTESSAVSEILKTEPPEDPRTLIVTSSERVLGSRYSATTASTASQDVQGNVLERNHHLAPPKVSNAPQAKPKKQGKKQRKSATALPASAESGKSGDTSPKSEQAKAGIGHPQSAIPMEMDTLSAGQSPASCLASKDEVSPPIQTTGIPAQEYPDSSHHLQLAQCSVDRSSKRDESPEYLASMVPDAEATHRHLLEAQHPSNAHEHGFSAHGSHQSSMTDNHGSMSAQHAAMNEYFAAYLTAGGSYSSSQRMSALPPGFSNAAYALSTAGLPDPLLSSCDCQPAQSTVQTSHNAAPAYLHPCGSHASALENYSVDWTSTNGSTGAWPLMHGLQDIYPPHNARFFPEHQTGRSTPYQPLTQEKQYTTNAENIKPSPVSQVGQDARVRGLRDTAPTPFSSQITFHDWREPVPMAGMQSTSTSFHEDDLGDDMDTSSCQPSHRYDSGYATHQTAGGLPQPCGGHLRFSQY